MTTNQYNRDFADFTNSPWPGKNIPENYNHTADAGDGKPGLQWMFQSGLAAYGPRHVIAGINVQSGAANSVTGTAGYYMWDGQIKEWIAASGVIAANQYAYISGDGTLNFASTGEYNSGLMIALSGEAGITNITQRWNANKLLYQLFDRIEVSQISGTYLSNITGNEVIFTSITGDNITLTGIKCTTISGSQFSGTSGFINNLRVDRFNDTYYVSGYAEFAAALSNIGTNDATIILDDDVVCGIDLSLNIGNLIIKGRDKHKITFGGSSYCIQVAKSKSLTLKDITLRNSSIGTNIYTIYHSSGILTCDNVKITGSYGTNKGIYILKNDTDGSIVRNCKIADVDEGIYNRSDNCKFINNTIYHNTTLRYFGIESSGSRNIIQGNHISGLFLTGINMYAGNYNTMNNNIFNVSGSVNISIGDCTGTVIGDGNVYI